MPTPNNIMKYKALETFNQGLEKDAKEEFLKFIETCRTKIELNLNTDDQELILFKLGTTGGFVDLPKKDRSTESA